MIHSAALLTPPSAGYDPPPPLCMYTGAKKAPTVPPFEESDEAASFALADDTASASMLKTKKPKEWDTDSYSVAHAYQCGSTMEWFIGKINKKHNGCNLPPPPSPSAPHAPLFVPPPCSLRHTTCCNHLYSLPHPSNLLVHRGKNHFWAYFDDGECQIKYAQHKKLWYFCTPKSSSPPLPPAPGSPPSPPPPPTPSS